MKKAVWMHTIGRLWLNVLLLLHPLDYVSVEASEAAAAASASTGGLHHVGKRMELQSCIGMNGCEYGANCMNAY